MQHPRLGTLRWDPAAGLWCAPADASLIRDREIGVAASSDSGTDLELAADFLGWIRSNLEAFKAAAAREAFNFDLIWDDDLDEAQLASKLAIQSVNIRGGFVEVWLDAGGATTDHLLLAKLDGRHKIVGMEL